MRRRVARVVRGTLALVGLILLGLLPVGWSEAPYAAYKEVEGATFLCIYRGSIQLLVVERPGVRSLAWPFGREEQIPRWEVGRMDGMKHIGIHESSALLPGSRSQVRLGGAQRQRAFSCPIWLLAFLCLAWQVTSFILARRRHKRGFPVEVATSSGVGSGPPLPPGEGGREATG